MSKLHYTLAKTLKILGCTEEQLSVLVQEGKIREYWINGIRAYNIEEIDAFKPEFEDKLPHEIVSDKFLEVLKYIVSFAETKPSCDLRLVVLLSVNEIEVLAVKMVKDIKELEKTS